MKKCPHCAASLTDTAIRCKYCRHSLDEPVTKIPIFSTADFKYRTFGRRVGASFIDMLIFIPIGLIEFWILSGEVNFLTGLLVVLFSSSFIIYSVWMHASFGQTFGKMVFKVKVVDLSEGKLSLKQAMMRDILPIVSYIVRAFFILSDPTTYVRMEVAKLHHEHIAEPFWFMLLKSCAMAWGILEIITMMTNRKRWALHDFIARSIVIKSDFSTLTLKTH